MDVGSVHSVHTTVSGSSSARSTPVPNTYRALSQSSSTLALAKLPNEEIKRRNSDELVQIIRRLENENRNLVSEHATILKDVNKKTQILLLEVRGLKDVNQNLQDDNQELRDLCCFLDDDRQRGRKLAREWQRFGRYTASVMRSEVSAYQEKLKELELKQQELISDNINLKELCLYLDQERLRIGQTRDDGDGSSSSTLPLNEESPTDPGIELVPVSQLQREENIDNTNVSNEYVRLLEGKIRQLEEEKKAMFERLDSRSVQRHASPSRDSTQHNVSGIQRLGPDGNQPQDGATKPTSPNKPEAVVHAMKVLEVHENLERPHTAVGEENLDDKEKAIVREMCNVVWRKLGNVNAEQQEGPDSDSGTSNPVYENLQPAISHSPVQDLPPAPRPPRTDQSDHSCMFTPQPVVHNPDIRYERDHQGMDNESRKQQSTNFRGQEIPRKRDTVHMGQYESRSGPTEYFPSNRSDMQHVVAYPAMSQYQRSETSQPNQVTHFHDQPSGQPVPATQKPPPQHSGKQTHRGHQPPKYGYIHTSRSTPVTPTPQQRSHSPAAVNEHQGVSQNLSPVSGTTQLRSSSRSSSQPGQSAGVQQQSYNHPTDSQSSGNSHRLYQNHKPLNAKTDHSYENVLPGYLHALSNDNRNSGVGAYDQSGSNYYSESQNESVPPSPAYSAADYSQPRYKPTAENHGQSRHSISQAPNYLLNTSSTSKQLGNEVSAQYNTQPSSNRAVNKSRRDMSRNVPAMPGQPGSSSKRVPPQYQGRHGYANIRGQSSNQFSDQSDGQNRDHLYRY